MTVLSTISINITTLKLHNINQFTQDITSNTYKFTKKRVFILFKGTIFTGNKSLVPRSKPNLLEGYQERLFYGDPSDNR